MATGTSTRVVHRRSGRRSALAVLLVTAFVAAGCSGDDDGGKPPTTPPSTTSPSTDGDGTGGAGAAPRLFGLRLSEGTATGEPAAPMVVVDGTPLDPDRIAEITGGLPAWTDDGTGVEEFKWPTETITAPLPGETVDEPFPPAEEVGPPDVVSGPLRVLRHQPDGEVPIAPFVTITFDQPMVPIGTIGQLAAADVPATITPAVPGHWQWIGTSTLRFDHDSALIDRLPMATEYRVEIPAGTRSASGGVLADTVSFTFATPPVTVQSMTPTDTVLGLTPVFVATFDQLVDPAAVLASVRVTADGDEWPVRLATAAEVDADDVARSAVGAAKDGRWIAFRPADPFPTDAAIVIRVGPGTPSAEGPRPSTEGATYAARTYAPLAALRAECGYGSECRPGTDINVTFNNPLDADRFDPDSIVVEPALAGRVVGLYGNVVNIRGATVGRTEYRITVPAGITDLFGQRLAEARTFEVRIGEAEPTLGQFPRPFTTLDPLANGQSLTITTINHDDVRVRLYSVQPSDWPAFANYVTSGYDRGDDEWVLPPFAESASREIDVDEQDDRQVETTIDLSGVLGGRPGHVVVWVEPTQRYSRNSDLWWRNRPAVTWAQSTSIGVDATSDVDELLVWATDLRTGAPLPGLSVQGIGSGSVSATTDTDGLARAGLDVAAVSALVVTSGADTALLPRDYYYDGGWRRGQVSDQARWYVFDDRGIYRPGETVSIKGWVRRLTVTGDAQLVPIAEGATIRFDVSDAQGVEIASGTTDVNALGGFDFTFVAKEGSNLGYARIQLTLTSEPSWPETAVYGHSVRIEEFRTPEFEVDARTESPGPYVSSRPATVAVDATYYSGGPLADAPVAWSVRTSASSYSPPGWSEFTFGEWTPWWWDTRGGIEVDYGYGYDVGIPVDGPFGGSGTVETYTGTTGADGTHYLQIGFEGDDGRFPDLPVTVSAQATVTDVNRQAWSSTTGLLVHPAELYVGLRSDRTFVRQGDPMVIEAIVPGIDGNAVAGRSLSITASRNEWVFRDGTWSEQPIETQTCDVTSAAAPVSCTFTTALGGSYTVSSTVADDQGGRSRTQLTVWVSGGDSVPVREVEQEDLTIVPDRAEYAPGDTAELLVQAPFESGEGLVTTSRNGIRSTQRFTVVDGSAVVGVTVADADIPGIDVTIEVVGATTRTADDGTPLPDVPPRPAYAVGGLRLSVPPVSRTLAVSATPRDATLEPGGETTLDISVADASGAPVAGAELAVVVVDEAVLSLTGYTLDDPLAVFYAPLYESASTQYGRGSIALVNPESLTPEPPADGGTATTAAPATTAVPSPGGNGEEAADRDDGLDGGDQGGQDGATGGPDVEVRTDFDALAVFEPEVRTGADGTAVVDVPLPDNLTRYRVMVVAVSGADRFGTAESNITARLPLMARPSAPRFLNFGDAFELPVVVQNLTDASVDVDVVLQTSNLTLTGPQGKRISVPANDRVEVRFPATTNGAGTARFRVAAVSAAHGDAAEVSLPVYTPATAEAFATYGVIDEGAVLQPLLAPTDVVPQFGGLEITTSSTSLQALTDAVIYIADYDYESSDAMASRIMAIVALKDVLDAFDAAGLPSKAELDAAVKRDVAGLVGLQNSDGGFAFWVRYRESEPYNSVQATHALVLARQAGYTVPEQTMAAALAYLRDIESYYPSEWGEEIRDVVSAYALDVRRRAGERDTQKAQALFDRRGDRLSMDALAWLWPVIDDVATDARIERIFQNRAVETAGAANFTTDYGDDAYVILHSDRRTDGIVLDALISERPASDLIPKVVTGLLAHRTKGRWDNIQENAFILLALKHYFDVFEAATPDFVARVWLGERYAGGHEFVGRTTDRSRISIPTGTLIDTGDTSIVVGKEGTGRLYYRLGLRYAPSSLSLDPLDRGFAVDRVYEAVDDPADVSRDADGTWRIRAGARVRVRLTMVAESQRTHVALIDPLPAGFEVLNPDLATSQDVPPDEGGGSVGPEGDVYWWWYWTWYEHQNLRTDRAEAFASWLPAGVYEYTYIVRATTPGTFVTPPTRAEEIYFPETFGRTATDTVVVG